MRRNAFRVLGLPGDAPLSAIHEAEAAMRRAAKLGVPRSTPWDLSFAVPLTRTEVEIRDALGRLAAPEQRLRERFLWLHGCVGVEAASPDRLEALAAAATGPAGAHDAAFLLLLAACTRDPEVKDTARWTAALEAWKACVGDEQYWEAVAKAEANGGFEPTAEARDVDALRTRALSIVAGIPAEIARIAASTGEGEVADSALGILRAAALSPEVVQGAQEAVLEPLLESVEQRCAEIAETCKAQIKHVDSDETAAANRAACRSVSARLDAEVRPLLAEIEQLIGADSEESRQARQSAAGCLRSIAPQFMAGVDPAGGIDTLEAAAELARGSALQGAIAADLAWMRETARKRETRPAGR